MTSLGSEETTNYDHSSVAYTKLYLWHFWATVVVWSVDVWATRRVGYHKRKYEQELVCALRRVNTRGQM